MTITDAIRYAMKETKTTQTQMAERLGLKSQGSLAMRLSKPNIMSDSALEMLELLGYELVIQAKKRGPRPAGQILVERGDEK